MKKKLFIIFYVLFILVILQNKKIYCSDDEFINLHKLYSKYIDCKAYEFCFYLNEGWSFYDAVEKVLPDTFYYGLGDELHYGIYYTFGSMFSNEAYKPESDYQRYCFSLLNKSPASEFLNPSMIKLFSNEDHRKFIIINELRRWKVFKEYKEILIEYYSKDYKKALEISLRQYKSANDLPSNTHDKLSVLQYITHLILKSGDFKKINNFKIDYIPEYKSSEQKFKVARIYFNVDYLNEISASGLKMDILQNISHIFLKQRKYNDAVKLLKTIKKMKYPAPEFIGSDFFYDNDMEKYKYYFKNLIRRIEKKSELEFKQLLKVKFGKNYCDSELMQVTAEFILDSLRNAVNADFAIMPADEFMGNIDSGVLTKNKLCAVLPYDNQQVYTIKLNGYELKRALQTLHFEKIYFSGFKKYCLSSGNNPNDAYMLSSDIGILDNKIYKLCINSNLVNSWHNGRYNDLFPSNTFTSSGYLIENLEKIFKSQKGIVAISPDKRVFQYNQLIQKNPAYADEFSKIKNLENKKNKTGSDYTYIIQFYFAEGSVDKQVKFLSKFFGADSAEAYQYRDFLEDILKNWHSEFTQFKNDFLKKLSFFENELGAGNGDDAFFTAAILSKLGEYKLAFRYLDLFMKTRNIFFKSDFFGEIVKILYENSGKKYDDFKKNIYDIHADLETEIGSFIKSEKNKKKSAHKNTTIQIKEKNGDELFSLKYPRYGHCSVTADSNIYILGGFTENGPTGKIELFDPQSGKTEIIAENIIPRAFAAAEYYNGKIYIFGGEYHTSENKNAICPFMEVFDLQKKKVILKKDIPNPRRMAASVIYKNQIYLIGGQDRKNGSRRSARVDVYDILNDKWIESKPMLSAKETRAVTDGSAIYVFGGYDGISSLTRIEKFDISDYKWIGIGQTDKPLSGHSLVFYNNRIIAVGDYDLNMHGIIREIDPSVNKYKFYQLPKLRKRRFAGVSIIDGKMFVSGGSRNKTQLYSSEIQVVDLNLNKVIETQEKGQYQALPAFDTIAGDMDTQIHELIKLFDVSKIDTSFFKLEKNDEKQNVNNGSENRVIFLANENTDTLLLSDSNVNFNNNQNEKIQLESFLQNAPDSIRLQFYNSNFYPSFSKKNLDADTIEKIHEYVSSNQYYDVIEFLDQYFFNNSKNLSLSIKKAIAESLEHFFYDDDPKISSDAIFRGIKFAADYYPEPEFIDNIKLRLGDFIQTDIADSFVENIIDYAITPELKIITAVIIRELDDERYNPRAIELAKIALNSEIVSKPLYYRIILNKTANMINVTDFKEIFAQIILYPGLSSENFADALRISFLLTDTAVEKNIMEKIENTSFESVSEKLKIYSDAAKYIINHIFYNEESVSHFFSVSNKKILEISSENNYLIIEFYSAYYQYLIKSMKYDEAVNIILKLINIKYKRNDVYYDNDLYHGLISVLIKSEKAREHLENEYKNLTGFEKEYAAGALCYYFCEKDKIHTAEKYYKDLRSVIIKSSNIDIEITAKYSNAKMYDKCFEMQLYKIYAEPLNFRNFERAAIYLKIIANNEKYSKIFISKYIELFGNNALTNFEYAKYLDANYECTKALSHIEKSIEIDSGVSDYWLLKAELLKKLMLKNKAIETAEALLDRFKQNDKNYKSAFAIINSFKDNINFNNKQKADEYYKLAQKSYSQEDYNQTELYILKAIELNSGNSEYCNFIGWMYSACKNPRYRKPKEALEYSLKAYRLAENNTFYLDTLANAYALNNNFTKAIFFIEKAIKMLNNKDDIKFDFIKRKELFKKKKFYIGY